MQNTEGTMNADAFIHQMTRFEQDVQEHPEMLKEWAAQEKLVHGLLALQRQLDLLAEAMRVNKR